MKIMEIEKEAYLKYLEANGNIETAYLKAIELGLTPHVFLDYVKSYIDKFDIKSIHSKAFDIFVNTVSEEKNVLLFISSKIAISELEKDFAIYIMKYFYGTEEFGELILKFKKCIRSVNRELGKNKVREDNNSRFTNIDEKKYIYATKIIAKFTKSKFSRERFILQNKLNYRDFTSYLAIVEKNNYEINEAYKRKIENSKLHDEENMTRDVFNLFELIKFKNGKLSLIDFFTTTNYGFDEIKKHADKVLNPIEAKVFRTNLTLLKTCDVCDNSQITSLFNDKFIITIYNIPIIVNEDTKSLAIEYLMQNDIPISAQTFREAIVLQLTNTINNQNTEDIRKK